VSFEWRNVCDLPSRTYVCGYCDDKVGPDKGYYASYHTGAGPSTVFVYANRIREATDLRPSQPQVSDHRATFGR